MRNVFQKKSRILIMAGLLVVLACVLIPRPKVAPPRSTKVLVPPITAQRILLSNEPQQTFTIVTMMRSGLPGNPNAGIYLLKGGTVQVLRRYEKTVDLRYASPIFKEGNGRVGAIEAVVHSVSLENFTRLTGKKLD